MATHLEYVPWDNTTIANFKSWAQSPGNALTAFGWSKVNTVNGTVNWNTQGFTPWTAFPQGTNTGGQLTYTGTLNFANAWSFAVLSLTNAANASGGTTVYTGTITGGAANGLAGTRFTVAGFGNANNNGTFLATASTTTTLTLNNPNGVSQAASATATVTYAIGDVVTNNNSSWLCTLAYTPTVSSPAPPYEWLNLTTMHWVMYAYDVWQSQGATPIYIRLEYTGGQGSTAQQSLIPRLRACVGTSVDTSGNLNSGTGNQQAITDVMTMTNPTPEPNISLGPCFFSGDSTNRFAMTMFPDQDGVAKSTGSGFFCVERSLDHNGNYYSTPSGVGFFQGAGSTYATASSKSFTATNVAGNVLVVVVSNGGTNAGTITISDTNVNTWTAFYSDTTVNGLVQKGWYAVNIAGGSNTVTVSWSTGAQNSAIEWAEYQGLAASPVDQNPATKTGSGAWSSNSITTTQAVEVVVTASVDSANTMSTNSPFIQRETMSTPSIFGILSDLVVTSISTISSSGGGSGNYATGIVSFKAAVNTPPVTPYWTIIWWGANNTGSTSGTGFIGCLIQTVNNQWIQTGFDTRIWTVALSGIHNTPPDQIGIATESGSGNQSNPVFPIWPLVGWVGNPMTAALTAKISDTPAYAGITATIYGASHPYLCFSRNGSFGGFGSQSGGNINAVVMRYD